MNAAASCHELPDCPNLFVDAFRGSSWQQQRFKENAVLILCHYHSDHYGNLPKEGLYQGPAPIHCTPITAQLLRDIHQIPDRWVVEHELGESWTVHNQPTVTITFYDANHCPGAAIIVVQVNDNVHVHTGDMRYCEAMRSYPLLHATSQQRRIDTVLLDTTYANPKHEFVPQETAIESIAKQVQDLLETPTKKTLVLLSCYSVGKEKVLLESSLRSKQLIYVSERKYRMLQCLAMPHLLERCTQNPIESDIHVIPMGTAGELWPFFQPNYQACADYAANLTASYEKVVAFIPTGWADASNWNKKHAINTAVRNGIEVVIRLVGYSEHSSFSELQAFVELLKPRKVIPTVFKDENERRRIEARFHVDTQRAKQHFIDSLSNSATISVSTRSSRSVSANECSTPSVCAPLEARPESTIRTGDADQTEALVAMGFARAETETALASCDGNLAAALDILLEKGSKRSTIKAKTNGSHSASKRNGPHTPTITSFFHIKKAKNET